MAAPLPRVLRTESRRSFWSFVIAVVPSLACLPALPSISDPTWSFTVVAVWYSAYLLACSTMTVLAFSLDFTGTRAELARRSATPWRRLWDTGQGADAAAWYSVVALGAAVVLAITGVSTRSLVLTVGTGTLVVSAWVNVLVSYAGEYARQHGRHGGLEFPGEQPRDFSDYLYFAAAVSTTFGPTDVSVTSRALRRRVLVHGLVAFVFNTVILALLISTLLG